MVGHGIFGAVPGTVRAAVVCTATEPAGAGAAGFLDALVDDFGVVDDGEPEAAVRLAVERIEVDDAWRHGWAKTVTMSNTATTPESGRQWRRIAEGIRWTVMEGIDCVGPY